MIHYAFQFCENVENSQEVDENLLSATNRVAREMPIAVLLKTRNALREIATMLETVASEKDSMNEYPFAQ